MSVGRLRLLDTKAIAVHFRVADGTVRRWASEDGWRSYGGRRSRRWDLAEAQSSYDRRHAADSATACG